MSGRGLRRFSIATSLRSCNREHWLARIGRGGWWAVRGKRECTEDTGWQTWRKE